MGFGEPGARILKDLAKEMKELGQGDRVVLVGEQQQLQTGVRWLWGWLWLLWLLLLLSILSVFVLFTTACCAPPPRRKQAAVAVRER